MENRMDDKEDKRIYLLKSYLDPLTMQETINRIHKIICQRKPTQHVVINAGKINLMYKNETLRKIVNESPLINADGQSIVWAGRFLGYSIPERVTGIDLFQRLVELAEINGWRLYYLGAAEEVVEKVVSSHQKKYPKLTIVGYRNGYFEDHESEQIAKNIAESQADIVFVAFSSPKKEVWIHTYQKMMKVPFIMGVGGSFDIIAGKTQRAPKIMQKTGLEWFFRFLQEPRRMFRRYFVGNIEFTGHVIKEKFVRKWSK